MATVVIQTIARPNNCNHISIAGTVDGVSRTMYTSKEEIDTIIGNLTDREKLVVWCYFRIKSQNATTPVQIKNALEGQTFKI